jgi:hypothetical protein
MLINQYQVHKAVDSNAILTTGVTKAMVGLTNADNISDANKPVSSAQLAALNLKANFS